ncbi:MAG: hypothetical protein ACRDF9_00595 [Candidatus Limnocylindria bacterium]
MYALDAHTVLRRYRRRDVPDREVALMRYVRERGYPAPEVMSVSGADLVLERATVRAHLAAAIERRMADPNMTAHERELIPLVRV